jgi:chromate transporter
VRTTPQTLAEIFRTFLVLGLTSFGGPIAHLAYFRTEFVSRRRWLSESDYADLVALCQFLPGPASSQVGFAIGLQRGGYLGALLAWVAFTLPSAAALYLFAITSSISPGPIGAGLVHGLKLAAVAVVAHAVWGMAQSLCEGKARTFIALAALAIALLVQGPWSQLLAIGTGALLGISLCQTINKSSGGQLIFPVRHSHALAAGGIHLLLLLALPILTWVSASQSLTIMDAFYRAGSLVFGGGHVVLPLLEAEVVPNPISADMFIQGYAAAQAVPGPLFTFASYLGAMWPGSGSLSAACLALIAIFAPGMLVLIAVLPFWNRLRDMPNARAVIAGMNATVVGLLGAALYDPVWTSAIFVHIDLVFAALGFFLLSTWKWPAWAVVLTISLCSAVASV